MAAGVPPWVWVLLVLVVILIVVIAFVVTKRCKRDKTSEPQTTINQDKKYTKAETDEKLGSDGSAV